MGTITICCWFIAKNSTSFPRTTKVIVMPYGYGNESLTPSELVFNPYLARKNICKYLPGNIYIYKYIIYKHIYVYIIHIFNIYIYIYYICIYI